MNTAPALIAFDLYGTLIRFGVMHHPFRKILYWAKEQGRKPQSDDARKLMTADKECEGLLAELGIFPPQDMLTMLSREIKEEVDSLSLFDDVLPTLNALAHLGVPMVICSNLAKPYGLVIERLLPEFNFIRCLSYEVGAIKPEKEIYDSIINSSGIPAEQILFVGDTWLADYDGPTRYGFPAKHLARGQQPDNSKITSLTEILPLFT